jgi:hypothetical protein
MFSSLVRYHVLVNANISLLTIVSFGLHFVGVLLCVLGYVDPHTLLFSSVGNSIIYNLFLYSTSYCLKQEKLRNECAIGISRSEYSSHYDLHTKNKKKDEKVVPPCVAEKKTKKFCGFGPCCRCNLCVSKIADGTFAYAIPTVDPLLVKPVVSPVRLESRFCSLNDSVDDMACDVPPVDISQTAESSSLPVISNYDGDVEDVQFAFDDDAPTLCDAVENTLEPQNWFSDKYNEYRSNLADHVVSPFVNSVTRHPDVVAINNRLEDFAVSTDSRVAHVEKFTADAIQVVNTLFKDNILLVAVLCTMYKLYNTGNRKWIPPLIAALCAYSYVNKEYSHSISEIVSKLEMHKDSADDDVLVPQSLTSDVFAKILSVCFQCYAFVSLNKMPSSKVIDSVIYKVSNFKRVNDGFADIIAWVVEVMEVFTTSFKYMIMGEKFSDVLHGLDHDVVSWCKNVEFIVDQRNTGKLKIDRANADKVMKLMTEYRRIMLTNYSGKKIASVNSALKTYYEILKRQSEVMSNACTYGAGPRSEPLVIYLSGGTGVGKSWLSIPFIKSLLQKVLPPDEIALLNADQNSYIYCRQQEHAYWDGYANQFVTVFDDYGQARDVAGTPDSEHMDIIRCANLFQNICHMASLDAKGNTVFCSKIILLTSNMPVPQISSLNFPDAVLRRFDIIANVSLNPVLCNLVEGVLCLKPEVKGIFNLNAYIFQTYKMDMPNSYLEAYTYQEFVDYTVLKYIEKKKQGDSYLKALSEPLTLVEPPLHVEALKEFHSKVYVEDDVEEAFLDSVDPEHAVITMAQINSDEGVGNSLIGFDQTIIFASEKYGVPVEVLNTLVYKLGDKAVSTGGVFATKIGQLKDHICDDVSCCSHCIEERLEIRLINGIRIYKSVGSDVQTYMKDDSDNCLRVYYKLMKHSCQYLPRIKLQLGLGNQRIINYAWANKFFNTFNDLVSERYRIQSLKYKVAATAITAVATVVVIHKLYRGISSLVSSRVFVDDKVGPNLGPSPSEGRVQNSKLGKTRRDLVYKGALVKQDGSDINSEEICLKVITKNLYEIYFPDRPFVSIGNLLIVKQNFALVARHYHDIVWDKYDEGLFKPTDLFTIEQASSGLSFKIPFSCMTNTIQTEYFDDEDALLFKLPTCVPHHPDITSCFIKEEHIQKLGLMDISVLTVREHTVNRLISKGTVVEHKEVVGSPDCKWVINRAVRYVCGTRAGDCGAPVVLSNRLIVPGKILGIHVAGHDRGLGVGISNVITCEALNEMLDELSSWCSVGGVDVSRCVLVPQSYRAGDSAPLSGFMPMYQLDYPVPRAMRTNLVKTKLYNKLTHCDELPARLRPFNTPEGELIDPMKVALSKYNGKVTCLDEVKFSPSINSYCNLLVQAENYNTFDFKPLTFEQSILGDPEIQYLDAIPRMTSAGFPHNTRNHSGFPGKTLYFGHGTDYDLSNQECRTLKSDVCNVIAEALRNRRCLHVYTDTLKDEVVSKEKWLCGKGRLVSCSPLVLSIVTRMYFLPFSMFLMSNRISNGSALGINPYDLSWSELYAATYSHGPCVFAGDFKGFDGSHTSDAIRLVGDAIVNLMGGTLEDQKVRLMILKEVYNSVHVCGVEIYGWTKGLPSGSILTSVINTFLVNVYMRYAWSILSPFGIGSLKDFDTYVYVIAYGDDNVVNVSNLTTWFDHNAVAKVLSGIGLTYTGSRKQVDEIISFEERDDITFLGRRFLYSRRHQRFLAPLCLETILSMTNYLHKNPDLDGVCKTVVDGQLRELSLHEKETFDKWVPKILEMAKKHLSYIPAVQDQETLVCSTFESVLKY